MFEDTNKVHLKGERVSVLGLEKRLEPDPKLAETAVRLPPATQNADWPQPGGNPSHAMQHLALHGALSKAWSTGIGDGASRYGRVLSQPVVADGRVYGMDAHDVVVALDAKTGTREVGERSEAADRARSRVWRRHRRRQGRVFVTTGYAQVLALDAATGKEIWRQHVAAPMRGAPTVADGRVFAVTVENQLDVLSTEDGARCGRITAFPRPPGLLGGASPAVEGDIVVVPYTSGELFALRVENGRPLWTDNLAAARSRSARCRRWPISAAGR